MTRSRTLLAALGALAVLACPRSVAAQTLAGVVLLPDSVTPAPQVLVEARTGGGRRLQALSNAQGRFTFRLRVADTVTVRAMRPGLRSTLAAPRFVGEGKTASVRLILGTERVTLAAVTVTANEDRVCGSSADVRGGQLWNEARTVLQSTVLTERDSALQIRAVEFEGRPLTDGTIQMDDSTLRVVPLGEVFARAHYDSLYRFGFIRRNSPGVTTYYAPNADLLADERFVATHCFRMAPEDTLADDVVGVRFEPSRRPRYTDVMGTLWLDVATYKLRRIEFSYVNPPLKHRTAGTGGTIEFTELATGHWITQSWTMRMSSPAAGTIQAATGSRGAFGTRGPVPTDFGLWARRQVVYQVTLHESLVHRDAGADRLARQVRPARGP